MIKRRRSSSCVQPQNNSVSPRHVSQSKHSVGLLKFSPAFQDPSWIGNVKIVLKHWSKEAVLTMHEKFAVVLHEEIFEKQKREDVQKTMLLYLNIYGNLVFPINHRYFAEIRVWNATFELRQNLVFVLSVLSAHKLGQIFLCLAQGESEFAFAFSTYNRPSYLLRAG